MSQFIFPDSPELPLPSSSSSTLPTSSQATSTATTSAQPTNHQRNSNAGLIAGAAAGGVLGLSFLLGTILCYLRIRKPKKKVSFKDPSRKEPSTDSLHTREKIQAPQAGAARMTLCVSFCVTSAQVNTRSILIDM